ncbi:MAG: hypothetical protein ACP5VP_06030 [Candidatus Limnocylindrales bacterium]
MILVDVVAIAIGSAYVLAAPARRNRRSVTFLAVLAVGLLAANFVSNRFTSTGLVALVGAGYVIGMTRYAYVLAGLTRAEAAYEANLRSSYEAMRRGHAQWAHAHEPANVSAARALLRDACESGIRHVTELEPPNSRWAEVAAALTRYLAAMRARAIGDRAGPAGTEPVGDEQLEAMGRELTEAWGRALRGSGPPARPRVPPPR